MISWDHLLAGIFNFFLTLLALWKIWIIRNYVNMFIETYQGIPALLVYAKEGLGVYIRPIPDFPYFEEDSLNYLTNK
jgi:ABC-type amino acid transport system permease subunit